MYFDFICSSIIILKLDNLKKNKKWLLTCAIFFFLSLTLIGQKERLLYVCSNRPFQMYSWRFIYMVWMSLSTLLSTNLIRTSLFRCFYAPPDWIHFQNQISNTKNFVKYFFIFFSKTRICWVNFVMPRLIEYAI